MRQTIDAKTYREMLILGAYRLSSMAPELNKLNVFPVADGDTGTNMSSTVDGGLSAIEGDIPDSVGELSKRFARAALLSARGNSGVILSQIFAGINEYLSECTFVGAAELCDAYKNGVKASYAAVQNPTEGTILTVFRESTEYAVDNIREDSSVEDFFRLHVEAARRSLAKTPELLPALREADVVDSGGAGYLCIAEGMYGALRGESVDYSAKTQTSLTNVDFDSFTSESRLEFGYCTELFLRLMKDRIDPSAFDISVITDELSSLGGESIVAYKTEDLVKIHVHSFTPGRILSEMQKYGEFLAVKIENMSLGHTESVRETPKKKLAVVSVATGEGLSALFGEMGSDVVIEGGQTANPSTGEFLAAFDKCNAETIIVLPNNKNILLSANQAAELYEGADVRVVETKNLMQGFSALSVINPSMSDIDKLVSDAASAAEAVIDGEITRAVRDVSIGGVDIKKDSFIAISGGEILSSAETAEDALIELLSAKDTDLLEILTVFVGEEVDLERRCALTDRLSNEYPDLEINLYEGGQKVYDYLVAIE